MNLIFFGKPGAGKGTQASLLASEFELKHIVAGDILRKAIKEQTSAGKEAESYMSKGLLVPDSIINEIVFEQIQSDGFVLDGFPRNIFQSQKLFEFMANRKINFAIYLKAKTSTIIKRLSSRCRTDDKNPEIVTKRLDVFQEETYPAIEYFRDKVTTFEVSSEEPIELVHKYILNFIEKGAAECLL